MRFDTTGLFWNDAKEPKISKAKEKRVSTPPEPVWERPDYLPYLDEAMAFEPNLFTDAELLAARDNREQLAWDIESYPNFFSVAFESVQSGKQLYFESTDDSPWFDKAKLDWVLRNFTLIDFNGEYFDRFIADIAVKPGTTCSHMYAATKNIIEDCIRGYIVRQQFGARKIDIDHIDLIELTALSPSLKTMAGRLGSPLMMDLPFKPGTTLSKPQQVITKWYNFNDLRNTILLYKGHEKNIRLREEFGAQYGLDLRSKSDAQMAEAIFRSEYRKRTGRDPEKRQYPPGYSFKFDMPKWVRFQTPNLQWLYQAVVDADFILNEAGYVVEPPAFKDLQIPIGNNKYTFGIGGLHSCESSIAHFTSGMYFLVDHDVASYYPKLILNSGKVPPAIGAMFVPLFGGIVDQRLAAKAIDKKGAKAEGLKIVVNGSFGKTMDPWSCLYGPELGMQTTISGQLALLMMIEQATLAGFEITNANTDGVVIKGTLDRRDDLTIVVKEWERQTGLEMETTDYAATFSRDVNNYIAVDTQGKVKAKGVYGDATLKKNPQTQICADAVSAYLSKGTPVETTIRECRDINKFITVRNARGGAAFVREGQEPQYVGKVVRYYYPVGETGQLVTINKGHQVAGSDGSRPIMRYTEFPSDIDYDKYISIARENLALLGLNISQE